MNIRKLVCFTAFSLLFSNTVFGMDIGNPSGTKAPVSIDVESGIEKEDEVEGGIEQDDELPMIPRRKSVLSRDEALVGVIVLLLGAIQFESPEPALISGLAAVGLTKLFKWCCAPRLSKGNKTQ